MTYGEMFGESTVLTGASGKQYRFSIFSRFTTFQPKGSVFVMGRAAGDMRFEFCFVGQTNDMSKRPLQPDKTACFQRFGVDHIFIVEEPDPNARAQVVTDLVQAYMPICNAP